MPIEPEKFFDVAVHNLPGGLILVNLDGTIRAVNQAAEEILGLTATIESGTPCRDALADYPALAELLLATCTTLKNIERQELSIYRPSGEKLVLNYGTYVVNKSGTTEPMGVGFSFRNITELVPLIDAHQFLDIAIKNLPTGLIFVDLTGRVWGVNQMAERLLSLRNVRAGARCEKVFADHPKLVKILLSTCQTQATVGWQELTTVQPDGEKLVVGYGTLIMRNHLGTPVGVGMNFQDITRFVPLPHRAEFTRLVGRFFTPFTLILVLSAMILGYAEPWARHLAVALVVLQALFNEAATLWAKRAPEWARRIGTARLISTFLTNAALVFLLGTFWGPMWLLFVLTPVATALYSDWKTTALTGVSSSILLLAIYYSRGMSGPVGWGQASLHAAFIVFISLFVNALTRKIMHLRRVTPTAKPASGTAETPPHNVPDTKKLAA